MLKNILKIIDREGYIFRTRIARELNTSIEMVDAAMDELLKTGYLVQENTGENCPTTCAKCPFAKNCGKDIVKMFKISEKGKRYLKS